MSDSHGPREALEALVEHFDRNLYTLKSAQYNEAQARQEFINPFFTLLGWDMDNRQGYAEAYKDVIHEDAIKVGGYTKAPDYCFRIGGTRKFFVEAKKPSVNIKDDPDPAYQLRRYAWSAKLPLSILTDFEELAVFDCRLKPSQTDKSSAGRVQFLTYRDYVKEWDSIASVFSREAVLKGSFDKYVESNKAKRGTAEVDAAFLKEIEAWRETLARNLALRNPGLTTRELNFAVQATLDRIIFLRICEDRGVEDYARLLALQNGPDVYRRLVELFRAADDRYNSGLFHFATEKGRPETPDTLTPGLAVDDKVFKDILKTLYYPESPYEFSVLPADILGQVYEQFLGKVIRLTAGHQAKVEDKPEVKKAGGVYYTPTYIVDYIVQNTVGKMLEGKTPREVSGEVSKNAHPLRILDPACGSGSFLLGAYQYLLTWYRDQYVQDGAEKWAKKKEPRLYQAQTGEWKLTTAERKRVLLDHIYGVDIDSQAVEVTKLSLLLKVLEGETKESVSVQRRLFHERALPDLARNIKCGNSLIGSDFYRGQQTGLFDEEERARINAFDWDVEFPEVFSARKGAKEIEFTTENTEEEEPSTAKGAKNAKEEKGFDVVIGNPPYLNIDDVWGHKDARLSAIKRLYPDVYADKTDILFYFLAKGVQICRGNLSFIVSRAFLEAYKAERLRGFLLDHCAINEILDFQNYHVFPKVGITTCIINLSPHGIAANVDSYKLQADEPPSQDLMIALAADDPAFERVALRQASMTPASWTFLTKDVSHLCAKIDSAGEAVGTILIIGQGMQTGRNDVFGKRSYAEVCDFGLSQGEYFKRASCSDILRYGIRDRGEYLLYLEDLNDFDRLPLTLKKYLIGNATELKQRAACVRGNCIWWHYTWPLQKEHYSKKRILSPYLAKENRFALDTRREFLGLTDTTVLFDNGQQEDLCYILALLNSNLLTFRFRRIGKLKGGGIYEYFDNSVSRLPIRRIDFAKEKEKLLHDQVITLVKEMFSLHTKLQAIRTDHDKTLLERQIAATDKEIDALVYDLYGLTEEEIRIVEGGQ